MIAIKMVIYSWYLTRTFTIAVVSAQAGKLKEIGFGRGNAGNRVRISGLRI